MFIIMIIIITIMFVNSKLCKQFHHVDTQIWICHFWTTKKWGIYQKFERL